MLLHHFSSMLECCRGGCSRGARVVWLRMLHFLCFGRVHCDAANGLAHLLMRHSMPYGAGGVACVRRLQGRALCGADSFFAEQAPVLSG